MVDAISDIALSKKKLKNLHVLFNGLLEVCIYTYANKNVRLPILLLVYRKYLCMPPSINNS